MNPTRWAFLYHGIQRSEVQQMEVFQATLIKALGLHLFPVKDKKTGETRPLKDFNEVTPFIYAVASSERLKVIEGLWSKAGQEQDLECAVEDLEDDFDVDLGTDTGLEILDRPIDATKLSIAERRQITEILPPESRSVDPEPKTKPETPKHVGSFSLDEES